MRIFTNKHLNDRAVAAFARGALAQDELTAVAEHIAVCPACLEKTVDAAQALYAPPRGFAGMVGCAVAAHERAKRREFIRYSATVAACVTLCVGVVLSGVLTPVAQALAKRPEAPPPAVYSVPEPTQDFFSKINAALAEAKKTDKAPEVVNDDKTKK